MKKRSFLSLVWSDSLILFLLSFLFLLSLHKFGVQAMLAVIRSSSSIFSNSRRTYGKWRMDPQEEFEKGNQNKCKERRKVLELFDLFFNHPDNLVLTAPYLPRSCSLSLPTYYKFHCILPHLRFVYSWSKTDKSEWKWMKEGWKRGAREHQHLEPANSHSSTHILRCNPLTFLSLYPSSFPFLIANFPSRYLSKWTLMEK